MDSKLNIIMFKHKDIKMKIPVNPATKTFSLQKFFFRHFKDIVENAIFWKFWTKLTDFWQFAPKKIRALFRL